MAVLIVTNVEWRRTVYSALDAFDIRTIRAGSLDEAVRHYTAEPDTFEYILADDTFGHKQTLTTIRDGIFPELVKDEHEGRILILSPGKEMFCEDSPLHTSDKVIQMPEKNIYVARDTVENAVNAILREKGIVY